MNKSQSNSIRLFACYAKFFLSTPFYFYFYFIKVIEKTTSFGLSFGIGVKLIK